MITISTIFSSSECGKTKKMTRQFTVWKGSNAKMNCMATPCYCYGRVCLMTEGTACNEGNVLIDGKAVCGAKHLWTKDMQNAICKELGFLGAKEHTFEDSKR